MNSHQEHKFQEQKTQQNKILEDKINSKPFNLEKTIETSLKKFKAFWSLPIQDVIENFLKDNKKYEFILKDRIHKKDEYELKILEEYKQKIDLKIENKEKITEAEDMLIFLCEHIRLEKKIMDYFPSLELFFNRLTDPNLSSLTLTVFYLSLQDYNYSSNDEEFITKLYEINGQEKSGMSVWKSQVEKGHPQLTHEYARFCEKYENVVDAFKWYERAAKIGNIPSWAALLDLSEAKGDQLGNLKLSPQQRIEILCHGISSGDKSMLLRIFEEVSNYDNELNTISVNVFVRIVEMFFEIINLDFKQYQEFKGLGDVLFYVGAYYAHMMNPKVNEKDPFIVEEKDTTKAAILFRKAISCNFLEPEIMTKSVKVLIALFNKDPENPALIYNINVASVIMADVVKGKFYAELDYYVPFYELVIENPDEIAKLAREEDWELIEKLLPNSNKRIHNILSYADKEAAVIQQITGMTSSLARLTQGYFYHPTFLEAHKLDANKKENQPKLGLA